MANSAAVVIADDNAAERNKSSVKSVKKESVEQNSVPLAVTAREHIKVVGVGGGGNNALNHIIRTGAQGVDFLAVNTDAHCLEKCLSVEKLIIGEKLTKGHGAGSRPEIGEQAAVESKEKIRDCLRNCDMVYLAAGMGGGTGTGATPVIAGIAKEMGILTVAVVTKPFSFEGTVRAKYAAEGIDKLKEVVDALIVVPNERLFKISEKTTSITDSFAIVDNVLRQAVQGVTDLITKPGYINVDFADVRHVMRHAGGAVMGIGIGSGENRAADALKRAIESPLMETSIKGAKGVILNVTAHPSVGILEVQEASAKLQDMVDCDDTTFIWGLVPDPSMGDEIQMVVIATGFDFSVVTGAGDVHPKRQDPLPRVSVSVSTQTGPPPRTVYPRQASIEVQQPTYEERPQLTGNVYEDEPAYLRRRRNS